MVEILVEDSVVCAYPFDKRPHILNTKIFITSVLDGQGI